MIISQLSQLRASLPVIPLPPLCVSVFRRTKTWPGFGIPADAACALRTHTHTLKAEHTLDRELRGEKEAGSVRASFKKPRIETIEITKQRCE